MIKKVPRTINHATYWRFEKIYFSFAALSVLLVLWQYFGMNRVVELYPSKTEVTVSGDYLNGGISEGKLTMTDEGALLNCNIKPSSTFAFCSFDIAIGDGKNKGLDFSQFESLDLWLEHTTTEPDTLIVYLINREEFSDSSDPSSRNVSNKSNQHAILPTPEISYYSLTLNKFIVPSWWMLLHKATGSAGKANLDNVISLQLATGDSLNNRRIEILFKRAALSGKWISADTLYLELVVFWTLLLLLHISFRLYQLANQLKLKRSQNASLAELNSFLSIQRNQFEEMAKTDPLTGVSNRAGMRDLFEHMQNQRRQAYSLIMFDIDYFKLVNDTHGHQAGDDVIKGVTDLVARVIRDTDHLARWGGEEFIIVCADTKINQAAVLANNLRQQIAQAKFDCGVSVTCSFGLSEYRQQGKNSIEKMFEVADAALYRAKNGGRNCVKF